jgi:hypothetical protein
MPYVPPETMKKVATASGHRVRRTGFREGERGWAKAPDGSS